MAHVYCSRIGNYRLCPDFTGTRNGIVKHTSKKGNNQKIMHDFHIYYKYSFTSMMSVKFLLLIWSEYTFCVVSGIVLALSSLSAEVLVVTILDHELGSIGIVTQ